VESIGKPHGSWAAVVKNKVESKIVVLIIEEVDGVPSARIPDSVFKEAKPLWEDFLVGKFLAKAPFVGGIHALVNKIWTLGDKSVKIDVFVVNHTTVRFRIKDERTRARVLRRGMWNLCGVPVVLSKWTPIVDMDQEEIKTMPLWVIVKNVPPKYFSCKVLSAITSPLGTPKKLHPDTEAIKTFEEAKVFVEVDFTKKLPKCFSFKSEKGGDTVVEYVYPWLPPRCNSCDRWGHLSTDCLSRKKAENRVEVTKPVETKVADLEPETSNGLEQSLKENKEDGNNNAEELIENSQHQSKDALTWNTPTKTIKSPSKANELRYGEVSILSNSFFCLSDKGEEVEEGEVYADIEVEKSDHVEDKWDDYVVEEESQQEGKTLPTNN